MSWYDQRILPGLIDLVCGSSAVQRQRQKVVPLAEGCVLEIGLGPGHNLSFYDPQKVERVLGLEPSAAMRARAAPRAAAAPFPVELIDLPGERIPLPDDSVDTVLLTYTLCTIPDALAALQGMRRVLRPGGRLLFCEHGRAPDPAVQRWQDRLDGLWGMFSGGCHLNRDIAGLLTAGGFALTEVQSMYLPGSPRWTSFNVWGMAE